MKVYIPTPLRSYTGSGEVEAAGTTLRQLLDDLDRRFPGIRFRIIDEQDGVRPHIKIFVNEELQRSIDVGVGARDEIHIICALSGGAPPRSVR
jgi:molybdopterin converting factor small subunit